MRDISENVLLMSVVVLSVLIFTFWASAERDYTVNYRTQYALKAASKDATSILRSDSSMSAKNTNFDGSLRESNDYEIDREHAMGVFMRIFSENMNPIPRTEEELTMNMIKGIAEYDGISLQRWDGAWYPKEPYLHYSERTNTIYYFTLGNILKVRRNCTINETTIDNEISPYDFMTMKQLKNKAIMDTINIRINRAMVDNVATNRTSEVIQFHLPNFEISEAGGITQYNHVSNILESPGVIAVYDAIFPGMEKRLRIANLAGSELGLQIK